MIKYSEEFALNIPTHELLHHVQYLGSVSGTELNKLELTRLPTFRGRRVEAPLLEGCTGWIECGVHDAYTVGDHTLFVGKVVAVSVEQDAFGETWLLNDPEQAPLHYLGMNFYGVLRERLEARIPQAADIKRHVEAGSATLGDADESEQRREQSQTAADRDAEGEW
jgi:flavin reductase (DIM6/NTAB) family NADH-FMN oxidoreductase RutF